MRKDREEYVSKREKYYAEKRESEEAEIDGVKLEKSDVTALIIAAFTTIFPFAIGIFLCLFLLVKLLFRF